MSVLGNLTCKYMDNAVIVVDDDKDFAESLADIFNDKGVHVKTAYSAQQAVGELENFAAQAAIIDIRLGYTSGIDLITDFHRIQPGIECIMMTGHADVETAIQAIRSGAYDYLKKPIDPTEIRKLVKRIFERNQLIAEKNDALSALHESEDRYRSILETASDGIILVDSQSRILYANKCVEDLFGYNTKELIGMSSMMIIPDMTHDFIEENFGQLDRHQNGNRTYSNLEFSGRHKNRTAIVLEISIGIMVDKNGNHILTKFLRDITKRKRMEETLKQHAEELARSNYELENFAYIASHDLQEPLRTISSFVQLLAKRYGQSLDEDARQYINFIVGGAKRMKMLIEDLLSYSRASRSEMKVPELVDCNRILKKNCSSLNELIISQAAVITHSKLPKVLASDLRIHQLFQNLIDNAIKYRSNNPPEIQIRAVVETDEKRLIDADKVYQLIEKAGPDLATPELREQLTTYRFEVEDNGIGIDPEYRYQVFLLFKRLHGISEYEGSGLGLALCKRIVENVGGQIWLESSLGEGSTFFFTLLGMK